MSYEVFYFVTYNCNLKHKRNGKVIGIAALHLKL